MIAGLAAGGTTILLTTQYMVKSWQEGESMKTDVVQLVPERRSAVSWLLIDSWIMTKRSITHIIRSFDQLLSVAPFPLMFLILNRYVFGGAIDTEIGRRLCDTGKYETA